MSKTQKTFEAVNRELAKNPNQTISSICKRLKLSDALYYNAKRAAKARSKTAVAAKPVRYKRLSVPSAAETPTTLGGERLVCVIGSSNQIREFLAGATH